MVTKAMLQEAAGIAENRRLQSIENMPQVEHQFSATFQEYLETDCCMQVHTHCQKPLKDIFKNVVGIC